MKSRIELSIIESPIQHHQQQHRWYHLHLKITDTSERIQQMSKIFKIVVEERLTQNAIRSGYGKGAY